MTGPLDDIRLREVIDLEARADTVRSELVPELDDRIEAAEDADDPEDDPDELRDLKETLEGQAKACERVVDALGGGEFVIQELMTAETGVLTDDVAEKQFDVDHERERVDATPKQGYHKNRTLELSIVDAPGEMEMSHDREIGREVYAVGKLPDTVADYLYECVTQLNDAGECDSVGNLSSYGVTSTDN